MSVQTENLSFSHSLKWKISAVIVVILLIVLGAISYLTFNSAAEIVRNQIDENINLVASSYQSNVEAMLKTLDRQIDSIDSDSSFNGYFTLMEGLYPGKEAGPEARKS